MRSYFSLINDSNVSFYSTQGQFKIYYDEFEEMYYIVMYTANAEPEVIREVKILEY